MLFYQQDKENATDVFLFFSKVGYPLLLFLLPSAKRSVSDFFLPILPFVAKSLSCSEQRSNLLRFFFQYLIFLAVCLPVYSSPAHCSISHLCAKISNKLVLFLCLSLWSNPRDKHSKSMSF